MHLGYHGHNILNRQAATRNEKANEIHSAGFRPSRRPEIEEIESLGRPRPLFRQVLLDRVGVDRSTGQLGP